LLLEKLIPARLRLHTPNGVHAKWLSEKVLEKLRLAGLATLRIGYESGLQRFGRETAGKTSRAQLERLINLLYKSGFDMRYTGVYVMGGLPNQSVEQMKEEISFVSSLGVAVKPVFFSPVPSTPLFDYYASQFPQIKFNPLWHNDLFFITRLSGWGLRGFEEVKGWARNRNNSLKI
jgi:radical SAM superfamily enzyme YgiQ (UPF0313 family)